ncbi:MAG: hypothetical protein Q9193_003820, partial [Seirophora villosa]
MGHANLSDESPMMPNCSMELTRTQPHGAKVSVQILIGTRRGADDRTRQALREGKANAKEFCEQRRDPPALERHFAPIEARTASLTDHGCFQRQYCLFALLVTILDNVLAIVLPTIVYAVAGGFFHLLDTYELFGNYRIHPTEDELKRNRITRWECLKGVVRYHVIQISIGLLLNHGASPPMVGDEACRIHDAANMIHNARRIIPAILNTIGIDAKQLSHAAQGTSPTLASIIGGGGGGGDLTSIITSPNQPAQNHLTSFDFALATFTTNILVPALQYLVALIVVDTWIYFTHRLCHVNRTLYRLVHAQHHRLYVSYAYGAVYAHWLETLFLDILSFVLAGEIARLSPRQSMLFASAATVKTIADHAGYVFPWDPLRFLNPNGARFHDLHHQTWGL